MRIELEALLEPLRAAQLARGGSDRLTLETEAGQVKGVRYGPEGPLFPAVKLLSRAMRLALEAGVEPAGEAAWIWEKGQIWGVFVPEEGNGTA